MSRRSKQVLMVAAENDAPPGGKVGGIGDVVRDLAPALAEHDIKVSVLTPAYGMFVDLPGAKRLGAVRPQFAGKADRVDLFEIPGRALCQGVRHLVMDHPQFSPCGGGGIYRDDPPTRPYATDATKFTLFYAAVTEMLHKGVLGTIDVLHLHDWHAGVQRLVGDLNLCYRDTPSLHERDCDPERFQWIDSTDRDKGVLAFVRRARDTSDFAVVIAHFTPLVRAGYRIGVPVGGSYVEILNTDTKEYGGSGCGNLGTVTAEATEAHGLPCSLMFTLPPLATLILRPLDPR